MKRTFGAGLTLAVILVAAVPRAQEAVPPPPPPPKVAEAFAAVDDLFKQFVADRHVPGAAWGIRMPDGGLHTGVTGFRDVPSKSPVTADSVFRIASMTKSFTAISILKLRDEGKLSLDDPAEKYVPEMAGLKYPTTDAPKITIRHLLSHAEGFPEDNPWGDRQLADTDEQLSQMLRAGIPFSNAPGLVYEYSNLGFAILGRIVTNVSKMRYEDYVAGQHPDAAGDAVDDARAVEGRAGSPGPRLPLGRRAVEGRAAAGQRLVRLDGRDADVGERSHPLRRDVPGGVAAARRPGAVSDPAIVAARDAAPVVAGRLRR